VKARAIVLDAYGTLFDVHGVIRSAGADVAGDMNALSQLWRQKQVEHTWRRALMGQYENFWTVTAEALDAAAAQLGIPITAEQADRLMRAYLAPPAFPEVAAALARLEGVPLAILSNGTMDMLRAAVNASGLHGYFRHVISVDSIQTYKPKPEVYALGPAALGFSAGEIQFVSSNGWDASGAKAFGYRVCWCNRSGATPDLLGFVPDRIVRDLNELATG
jgi:2-haloacid dehalogenase